MTETTSDHNSPGDLALTDPATEDAALRTANKAALFEALAHARIDKVLVRFDGYGDSGQIEDIEAIADGRAVALPDGTIEITELRSEYVMSPPSTMSLPEAVEELVYACLDEVQSGWENGEGAYGDFVFDVAARTIALDFNEQFTDANFSQHSF